MRPFRETIVCEVRSLGDLRSALRAWLDERGIPVEERPAIVLVAHEAAANAVEHAGPDASVTVEAHLEPGRVVVEVTDSGNWRSGLATDNRGRGLALIAALVSELQVRPGPDGTTVRMVCTLGDDSRFRPVLAASHPRRNGPSRRVGSRPRRMA